MRNAQLGGWTLAAVLLLAGAVPAQADREINLFFNNFDSSAIGMLPAPWQLLYDGTGVSQQVVSQDYALSGKQSLKLVGSPVWSAVVQRTFKTGAPVLGSQFSILIPRYGPMYGEYPGLYCQGGETRWGTYYGVVIFDHGSRKILDFRDQKVLGTWSPGVWHKVRTLVDRVNLRAKVWIDNRLLVDGRMMYDHPEWINAISLGAGHSGIPVYYDNVRVFLPGVQEMGGLLLDEVDALVLAGNLSAGNGNALKRLIQEVLADEEGGDYGAAIEGLMSLLGTAEVLTHPSANNPPDLTLVAYVYMTRIGEQMILQLQYLRSKS